MLVFKRYDVIDIFRWIDHIFEKESFADMIESRIIAESHPFEDILQDIFFKASHCYYDEIFRDIDILDFIMGSEFCFELESVLYLLYSFITLQCVASYDKYLVIAFPMSSRFHKVPHLIEQE